MWRAPFTTVLTHGYTPSGMNYTLAWDTPVTNETAAVGVMPVSGADFVETLSGGSVGILSCETNISEVVRCSCTNSKQFW